MVRYRVLFFCKAAYPLCLTEHDPFCVLAFLVATTIEREITLFRSATLPRLGTEKGEHSPQLARRKRSITKELARPKNRVCQRCTINAIFLHMTSLFGWPLYCREMLIML